MCKRLLIIGAGQFQVPVIEKAKELHYEVIATDFDENAVGFKKADIAVIMDTTDIEGNLNVAKKYKVDGVLTTSDYPVRTVAYICEKLGLKGLSPKAAQICTNKYLQRDCYSRNNIICPQYWNIKYINEIYNIKKQLCYPCVVKPVDSSASRGVIKVNSFEELLLKYYESIHYSKSSSVIIEEFILGQELSVECIVQYNKINIIALTQKTVDGAPYFVETRHIIPADVKNEQKKLIEECVSNVIKTIGLDNSAAHVELKLTSKGPVIIEVGARLGGDYITSDLVPIATGIDMLKNIIKISLGEPIEIEEKRNKFSAIQFITCKNYEKIHKNIDFINNDASVFRYEINEKKNELLSNSQDRLGYVIVEAENREKINRLLSSIIS